MSWIEDNAIKRIFNVFKRNKSIFKEDIEALKIIKESIEFQNKQLITNNLLYAKLISIQLRQNLNHFGSIEMAIKILKEDISKPLNYNLQLLQMDLNNTELSNYFKSIGLKDWNNEVELNDNKNIKKENQKEMIDKIQKSWNLEEVEKAFYKTANQIIKDVTNYE